MSRAVCSTPLRKSKSSPAAKFWTATNIITPNRAPQGEPNTGVDIYISTSSAGGGLQMMVTGVVQNMTGESAQRAALGAGAIVIDVLASNDGRLPHEKIERIRTMRPDMILMSGGTAWWSGD